jgi:hypothetical protein
MFIFALAALASAPALAGPHGGHGGHGGYGGHGLSLGLHFGAPFAWYEPYYYHPPYSYSPPVVAAPATAPVYVEQAQNWWYYCKESRAYYPYVKACAGGWQRVAPTPPAQ